MGESTETRYLGYHQQHFLWYSRCLRKGVGWLFIPVTLVLGQIPINPCGRIRPVVPSHGQETGSASKSQIFWTCELRKVASFGE
jgi:hypothetical protein